LLGAGDVVIQARQSRNAHGFDAIPQGQPARLAATVDFLGQQFMDDARADTACKRGFGLSFSLATRVAAIG
jgi:hypothetical protein